MEVDQESGTSRLRGPDPPISTSCAFIYALVLIFFPPSFNLQRDTRASYLPSITSRVYAPNIFILGEGAIRKWQVSTDEGEYEFFQRRIRIIERNGRRKGFVLFFFFFVELWRNIFVLSRLFACIFFFCLFFLSLLEGKKKKNDLSSFCLFVCLTYFKKYIYRYLQSYPRHISRSSFPIDRA